MKITIIFSILIVITIKTNAQIPNNGFENWTNCMSPTTYNITQANENSVMFQYKDSVINGQDTMVFYNYFSPNGDGVMDLCVIDTPQNVVQFDFRIWDLCGAQLFASADVYQGWDGSFQGNPASKGILSS